MVRRVLALLDENEEVLESAVIYGYMGMELRRLAVELLPMAARKVMLEADFGEINESLPLGLIYTRCDDGTLEMELTPDFLRLVELRMSDWRESLYAWCEPAEPVAESGPVLRHHPDICWSRSELPAAMPSPRGNGRVIRIFGSGRDAYPVTGSYLPEPVWRGDKLWMPSQLVDRVVIECAEMIKEVVR